MDISERVQAAERQPIQEARIKREARRLADWTGIALSESQEITARAFGATSWQALQKDPTFVPDEHLDVDTWSRSGREARYAAIRDLLSERLRLCTSQALLLAAAWQPTALRADSMLWFSTAHGAAPGDWKVLHSFGAHPSLGEGTCVLLAVRNPDLALGAATPEPSPTVVVVPQQRLARFLSSSDVAEIVVAPSVARFIAQHHHDLIADDVSRRRVEGLAKRLQQSTLSLPLAQRVEAAEPTRLKARWLTGPLPSEEITSLFATKMPWHLAVFPGLKKSQTRAFWAMQTDHLGIRALVRHGTIWFELNTLDGGMHFHSDTYAGVGGLRYLAPRGDSGSVMRLFEVDVAGFYLVKYENQPKSARPIPHMNEALAQAIRSSTGLSDGAFQAMGAYSFFGSDAGLALAQWAATFPSRAHANRGINTYTFDWMSMVRLRMEFELIRRGAWD
ncbi:MAG: hypothetical protein O9327_03340 [Polaromonas sp.]|nr:hypothetical protein [Polaromonas sp.]